MKIFLVLASILCIAAPVSAANLPQYDVKAYCKQVADFGGGSNSIELGCREMEAEAQKALLEMDAPQKILNYCRQVAEVGGAGSYSMLQGCIEMEQEAASKLD